MSRWDRMKERLQRDDEETCTLRQKLLNDAVFNYFYQLTQDPQLDSIPVAREYLVALLQRYEQLAHGRAVTTAPNVRHGGNYNEQSERDRIKNLTPSQLATEVDSLMQRVSKLGKKPSMKPARSKGQTP